MRGLLKKESTQVGILIVLSNAILLIAQMISAHSWLDLIGSIRLLCHSSLTTMVVLIAQTYFKKQLTAVAKIMIKVRKTVKIIIALGMIVAFSQSYFCRLGASA